MATLVGRSGRRAMASRPQRARTLRRAFAAAWPIALVAWLYERTADLGFNVLDEGLMASYSNRILHGEVPHRDFISPRPVVSAVLHLPDLVIPLPLYLAGRLVGIAEVVAFSILIAWLIYRTPPWEWGPVRAFGAAASALVNLHTFGETAWYTFDGLILTAAALLLVEKGTSDGRRGATVAGLLLAGLALTTKQSFFPAPLIAIAWVGWAERRAAPRVLAGRLATAAAIVALPMAVYLAAISVLGGLPDAFDQLTSGRVVWGRSLLEMVGLVTAPVFGRPLFHGHFPWEVALAAGALCLARRRPAPEGVRLALGALLTLLTLRLALHQQLTWQGSWSLELMWALVLVLAVRALFERRIDWRGMAVLLMAWMAMLSWGYEVPALLGGSMALAIAAWALEGVAAPARSRTYAFALVLAAAAVFVYTADQEISAREAEPYYDRAASELTASVGDVDDDFAGIRTSPVTASYMHGLQSCLQRYPAGHVAVIPDNPGVYVAMGLHNPFPIDWFWTPDYRGQRARIIDAAFDLEQDGHYLVLFQTVSGLFLTRLPRLPDATRRSVPLPFSQSILYDPTLAGALIRVLKGRHVVCGSFLGIYSP
jgi:hypothetical protein